MRFSARRYQWDEPRIGMTPIIDVVFNLLIFFLVGAQITEQEKVVDVALPESSQGRSLIETPLLIVINVYKEGRIVYQGRPLVQEALYRELRQARSANPEQRVELRGDKESMYGLIVDILTVAVEAGFPSDNIHLSVREGAARSYDEK